MAFQPWEYRTETGSVAIGFEPAYARMDDWTAFVTNDISRMREVATRSQIRAD